MEKTGFYYYFDRNGLDLSRLNFYWDFNSPGNSSRQSGLCGFSGVNTGSLWSSGSRAYLNNSYILPDSSLIDSDAYTVNLTFLKVITGAQVLFEAGSGLSGFSVGVSDSNKLFCSAYDSSSSGFIIKTFDFNLASKNSILIKKNGNSVSLSKFNYTDKVFNEEYFIFPPTCNLEPKSIKFGSGNISHIKTGNTNFQGFFDYALCYNESVDLNLLNDIQKSFYKQEPSIQYGLIGEVDNYTFRKSNNPNLRLPSFEENTSGALEYIRSNLFNITGRGTIKFDLTGKTNLSDPLYTDFSGRIYGTLSTVSGYYEIVTTSGVTGFTTSGQVVSASGITGYQTVELPSIPVWHSGVGYTGKIYKVFVESGVSGATEFTDVFTDPVYQVTSGDNFVEGVFSTNYNISIPPFTSISNSPNQSADYVLRSSYTNDGSDKIILNHKLTYNIDDENLYIIKKTILNYGDTISDSQDDVSFLTGFNMNGIFLLNPLESGSVVEFLSYTGFNLDSFELNTSPEFNNLSGFFFENNGAFNQFDNILVSNGVHYLPSGIGYEEQFGFYKTDLKFNRNFDGLVDKKISGAYPASIFFTSSLNSGINLTSKKHIFFNGVKLVSGYHYTGSVISNNLLSGASGYVYSLLDDLDFFKQITTGEKYLYDFPEKRSVVLKNGIRQYLDQDYVEFSNLDPISNLTELQNLDNRETIVIL